MAKDRKAFLWVNLSDVRFSFECEWLAVQPAGAGSFNNIYVAPKVREDSGSSSPPAAVTGSGIWVTDGATSSQAFQIESEHYLSIALFLHQLIERKDGVAIFQVPRKSGYIIHADPWAVRVADCAIVSATKSLLLPLQEVAAASQEPFTSIQSVARALGDAAGIVASNLALCERSVEQLEFELGRRLSFPLLSPDPTKPLRVLFITWSRISAKRASWATAKALGLQIVIASSGAWSEADPPLHELFLDGYIDIDLTNDENFWRRIVHAVQNYPDHIDGICAPWDAYMVPCAKAAQHLGLFTSGPESYTISTNKFLTRQLIDSEAKEFFTIRSLEDLESRLASDHPLTYPVVCKPVAGTGSAGVFRADDDSELRDTVAKTFAASRDYADRRALIEPYVDGPEVDCNVILLDGRVLYSEVIDDFPCKGDLSKDSSEAVFIETQTAVPSGLPKNEQKVIVDGVVAAILQQGFRTGVFHCEARIRNSSVKYVLENGDSVPDLKPLEMSRYNGEPNIYLHEINARMPGPMSSASTMIARGIDFYSLVPLIAAGDWRRLEALSQPFLHEDVCDNTWLVNCAIEVSPSKLQPLFPDRATDDLVHTAVDNKYSPVLELVKTNPNLAGYAVRHFVYIEPARVLGGKDGDWLWVATMVVRSTLGREHAHSVVQGLPAIYEDYVRQKYGA